MLTLSHKLSHYSIFDISMKISFAEKIRLFVVDSNRYLFNMPSWSHGDLIIIVEHIQRSKSRISNLFDTLPLRDHIDAIFVSESNSYGLCIFHLIESVYSKHIPLICQLVLLNFEI